MRQRYRVLIMMWTLPLMCTGLVAAQDAPASDERVRVRATGQAPAELPNAREAAVEDALRRAVEAGMGVEIASSTEARDFMLVRDVIYTRTAGYVQRYDVLEENPDQDGLYTVRVEAVVTRGKLDADAEAFRTLLRRKGHPRLMVVGSAAGEPFDARLTAELQGMLERRGLTVIDLARLNATQRQQAERAARYDEDVARAVLIGQELGADYLVIVSVQETQHAAEQVYDMQQHRVEATGILKVVRADTAHVLASEVVHATQRSADVQGASREATTRLTQQAMGEAIGRIAAHWLEDVDQRGGQQIELVLRRFPFERVNEVAKTLREDGGVRDVIIDRIDAEGRSQLRVVTNASAADVATVVQRLHPSVRVAETTGHRIELAIAEPFETDWSWGVWLGAGVVALGGVGVAVTVAAAGRRSKATA